MDMFRALTYYGMWRGTYLEFLHVPVREVWATWEWLRTTKKAEAKAGSK